MELSAEDGSEEFVTLQGSMLKLLSLDSLVVGAGT
jgi:hypothetical protein